MQIIVRGNGLHKSETNALDQMQKHLRDSWYGYASVLVADKQGSMEFDLLSSPMTGCWLSSSRNGMAS
ncbi:hypothetical protein [Pseudomonas aeruginosa]|uniref:hypothetical protein n=1 Tax=Pseudomonas aeruginosa TaxID=287 RepID=UPI0021AACBB9|nr:hypothetical protein [Pseudomonas aeruginosa]